MMPAAANTVKNLKFWPTICWLRKVSSLTKITEAIEVPLIMLIVSLAMPGRMARIACGRMIRRSVSNGPMPNAAAATVWLRLTDRMPPRMISALNAASFRAKPMTAVVKVSSLMPIAGQRVVEKDQLQELRRAAHEPDVDPGSARTGAARQPHERQPEAEEDAADHRQRRDLHGQQRALEEEGQDDVAQKLAQPAGLALAVRRAAAGELGMSRRPGRRSDCRSPAGTARDRAAQRKARAGLSRRAAPQDAHGTSRSDHLQRWIAIGRMSAGSSLYCS